MNKTLMAKATITISAPASKVWEALTNPELIKQYLFGADVISDWKEGSPIIYKGIYEGKAYEDKGKVLTVSYDLAAENGSTQLTITQDNNPTIEEQNQNANFWKMVLDGMKKLLEGGAGK